LASTNSFGDLAFKTSAFELPIKRFKRKVMPTMTIADLVPEIKVIVHREGEVRKAVVAEPVLETVIETVKAEEETAEA